MPQQQTILCAWKPVPFGKWNIIRGMINDGVFADFHLSKCLWRLFALCPLSAVTLFKYYQQKLLGLIDNKKNHSIWTPNGEMLQAFELCRLSISIKLQAQKLSQSECQPCLTLKNLSRWIKVSTLLNLPQILRVFKIQLGSVVIYWVQRNLSPTASLLLYANCLWATWKEKTPHQRTSEALTFTLNTPSSNVGGRTTFEFDEKTLQFVVSENIQRLIKNIFQF